MDDVAGHLGNNIRQLRETRGLTQQQMAKISGVPRPTWARARPFSVEELTRRQRVAILGVEVWLATAEDTVLAKLEWASLSDSERQERDVTAILRIRGTTLDWAYMERWADELGVRHELRRIRQKATDK